jgi:hypothetical protein
MKYGELYEYVDSMLSGDVRGCNHNLKHCRTFAQINGLDWKRLKLHLEETGGYCDCEVMMNTPCHIDDEVVIGCEPDREAYLNN